MSCCPIPRPHDPVRPPGRFLTMYLQVGVLLVGQGHLGSILHLLLVLLEDGLVDLDFRGSQSGGGDEFLRLG